MNLNVFCSIRNTQQELGTQGYWCIQYWLIMELQKHNKTIFHLRPFSGQELTFLRVKTFGIQMNTDTETDC